MNAGAEHVRGVGVPQIMKPDARQTALDDPQARLFGNAVGGVGLPSGGATTKPSASNRTPSARSCSAWRVRSQQSRLARSAQKTLGNWLM